MTGYASDQFFGFSGYETTGQSIHRKQDDNPSFLYPANKTTPLFTTNGGEYTSKNIQRGFIRGIYPAALGKVATPNSSKVKQRRLFFQFNPTTLDRSVSMSSSVLNPLLQDPSNLLQPVPGMSDFSFDILFNREAEVVSKQHENPLGTGTVASNSLTGNLSNYGSTEMPTTSSDVSNIGVLADLYVLDSIIGQSITQDMVDFLKDYWNNASTLSQTSYDSENGGASFSFDSDKFQTTVQSNFGNAAFLSPLPIRVVFSSLFMVEGFVTSSSVQFIKFTSNYVPTICKVTLQIRALYIGFAREKAYLSNSLETAVAAAAEDKKTDDATERKIKQMLNDIHFKFFSPTFEKYMAYRQNSNDPTPEYTSTSLSSYDWNLAFLLNASTNVGYESVPTEDRMFIEGDLETYVGVSVANAVKDELFTWDFSANATMTEIHPAGVKNVILDGPITFATQTQFYFNSREDISTTDIANNAVKTTNPDDPRKNKWRFPKDLKVSGVYAGSSFLIEIKLTITIQFTGNSGARTVVSPEYIDSYTFLPTSPTQKTVVEKWQDRGGQFKFPKYGVTSRTGA
jgi:hypothetical protein